MPNKVIVHTLRDTHHTRDVVYNTHSCSMKKGRKRNEMTDKEIEDLLNKIYNSHNGKGYVFSFYSKNGNISEETAKQFDEVVSIIYLEKELNLVVRFFKKNKKGNFVRLSAKGLNVIKQGGYINYLKNKKKEKNKERIKKGFIYWFNILVPMITIYLAYLAITYDTKSMKEELLIELRNTNQISIEREVKSYMEKLNSKNKDSVLLNFVK